MNTNLNVPLGKQGAVWISSTEIVTSMTKLVEWTLLVGRDTWKGFIQPCLLITLDLTVPIRGDQYWRIRKRERKLR